MPTPQTWIVLILAGLLGLTAVGAQEVAPAPPPLQVVHALLALSYPELRASGLVARAVSTPDGVVMEFAERGPADPDLVARTAPRSAKLTATVTLDGEGHLRHLVCRGSWTGLDHSRAVIGHAREGVEARLAAAQARFGGAHGDAVTTEARRLLRLHALTGARLDGAALQDAQGTLLWVAHGVTEAGEALAVQLEPLTGRLIAFHVGGDR